MSANTSIEWTDRTWNPVTGCQKVSAGCKNCYAEGVANRFWHHQYVHTIERGFIPVKAYDGDRMTGTLRKFTDVMTHEDRLLEPLSWRKPSKVFVNSMSDLFHEDVSDEFIARAFAVMARARKHTFQILTKRPKRMQQLMSCEDFEQFVAEEKERLNWADGDNAEFDSRDCQLPCWPLSNIWLGVSVENQDTLERIDLLKDTPAAIRFVSFEPLLEDLGALILDGIHWAIVGGESGHHARRCDIEWIRSVLRQCRAAAVPCFIKQLGSNPLDSRPPVRDIVDALAATGAFIESSKGGDPDEWPVDLRVREFPTAAVAAR